mmetsp:Transcript_104529/g.272110  ORF Transcript_104529/g.272110 Transcript_104529/m.272110 type:complete len:220 (-) Transcript_104529:149-808(-)
MRPQCRRHRRGHRHPRRSVAHPDAGRHHASVGGAQELHRSWACLDEHRPDRWSRRSLEGCGADRDPCDGPELRHVGLQQLGEGPAPGGRRHGTRSDLRRVLHRRLLRLLLLAPVRLCQDAGPEGEARPGDRSDALQGPHRLRNAAGQDRWHHSLVDRLPDLLRAHRAACDDHLDCAGSGQENVVHYGRLNLLRAELPRPHGQLYQRRAAMVVKLSTLAN